MSEPSDMFLGQPDDWAQGGNETVMEPFDYPQVELARTIFIVAAVLMIPVAVIGNLLVFFGILLYPGFYNNSNVILMAIASFDFFMGIECLPITIMCYVSPTKYIIANNRHLCVLKLVSPLIAYPGSLYCLMLLSVDRYLAIMFPFKYHIWITFRRCIYITLAAVFYTLITALLPLLGWNNYNPHVPEYHKRCYFYGTLPRFLLTYMFMVPNDIAIAVSIAANCHIGIVVFRQLRSFKAESALWTHEQKRNFNARMSTVKITLALMCLFILFTAPYLSVLPFKMFNVFPEYTIEAIKVYTNIPLYGNAVVNGPVYALIRSEYRDVYRTMLTSYPWKWKKALRKLYRERNTSFVDSSRLSGGKSKSGMTSVMEEESDETLQKDQAKATYLDKSRYENASTVFTDVTLTVDGIKEKATSNVDKTRANGSNVDSASITEKILNSDRHSLESRLNKKQGSTSSRDMRRSGESQHAPADNTHSCSTNI
ncbi:adenosine receptor A2a-like [Physella acuta]|uniref:adenosine receptor A2a-like n=1 Tax=Physella acuta TaxID=109671 RepID=UPI0027DE7860|nr:adenosine receptor A2a-like [Physella acuta]